jgi:hypothetical protein
MKVFTVNGAEYGISACTAIAECDNCNEEDRQDALLVICKAGGETAEHIVFGWNEFIMPENEEDFIEMCNDPGAWETLSEEHIVRINGMTFQQYRDSIYGWLTATYEED